MKSLRIIAEHNAYRRETLNLQASENYLDHEVRGALASDMASRYSMVFDTEVHGAMVHNAYGGAKYQEEITELAESLARNVFGFKYANVKPISGHIAAMAVLISLTERGDKIMAIPPENGGYDGYSTGYMPDMFGLKYEELPITEHRNVDADSIRRAKPNLVILGASYILFPYNLKDVLDAAEEVGAKVVYDASHVMGLLPSGFQSGIEKCDVVYGSTHKSYPGPQGGLILTNSEEIADKIEKNLTWRVQDNYHTNRVAALAVSLERFSPVKVEYGERVRENTQTLASNLDSLGIGIKYPPEYSRSHQILVSPESLRAHFGMSTVEMSKTLERNGMIVDCVGRIGTAELTWKGYGPEDMVKIAEMIHTALKGEDVSADVEKMVSKWDGKTISE